MSETHTVVPRDIAELVLAESARINSPAFIADDPVQFPRRFTSLPDIEIAGLLSATIAWGNRRMICRDCDRMLTLMDNEPYRYLMEQGYEDMPDELNLHRTFFGRNFKHYLRGLHRIYSRHGSLRDFAVACGATAADLPPWRLVEALNEQLRDANPGCPPDARCLPTNVGQSALKRINMWLRWMVRDDGIVDLGVWAGAMRPDQLYIPLDVHSAATSRELGLLKRRSNDCRAVLELTSAARSISPADPALLDFALFGLGMRL